MLTGIGVLLLACASATETPAAEPVVTPLWRETWVGADATAHTWLVYSGTTVSPFSDMWSDGLRLRIGGGYGRYAYSGDRRYPGQRTATRNIDFKAETSFTEGLAGYLWRLGPLTAKAFAGVAMIGHSIAPDDPLASTGTKIGPKAALELWLNLGNSAFASLDVTYTSAHTTYSANSRVGYRVLPTVSLGLEGGINGSAGKAEDDCACGTTATGMLDPAHRDVRAGAFARYEWFGGEVSISGGLSTDLVGRRDPYLRASWIAQY
jgi:hypothetical protein